MCDSAGTVKETGRIKDIQGVSSFLAVYHKGMAYDEKQVLDL